MAMVRAGLIIIVLLLAWWALRTADASTLHASGHALSHAAALLKLSPGPA